MYSNGSSLRCGSFHGGAADLGVGAEPVIYVVAVLAPAGFIEFVCPTANLFMQIRGAGRISALLMRF